MDENNKTQAGGKNKGSDNESFVVKNKTQTMAIDNALGPPGKYDKQLGWAGYSRFSVTIIDKSQTETKIVKANIPAIDMLNINRAIQEVRQARAMYPYFSALISCQAQGISKTEPKPNSSGKALTNQRFIFGKHKGRTVTEVANLNDGSDFVKELSGIRKILSENVEKFANNPGLINDIDIILEQVESGKVTTATSERTSIPSKRDVYKVQYKPIMSHSDGEGRYLVYDLVITCDFKKDSYPWQVNIVNRYAPVSTPDGRYKVHDKEAIRKADVTMNLSDSDFSAFFDKPYMELQAYTNAYFPAFYKEACARSQQKIKAATTEK